MSTPMTGAYAGRRRDGKDSQSESVVPRLAGLGTGGFLGGHPFDDGGELYAAGHVWEQPVFLGWP